MQFYSIKMPVWLPRFFPKDLIWRMRVDDAVYLTFDDGPHPEATTFVLDTLKEYFAQASFFCIGKNVAAHPSLYQRIMDEGHAVGNHTYNHLNGWKTPNDIYLKNILKASKEMKSRLFRPPYGRIKISQSRRLIQRGWKVYMWDVLSADFDMDITPEQCLENVLTHIEPGSIVVFHDSEKAFPRMKYALPEVLKYCREKGWKMKKLS
ncbi:MAG TPA: polysaccharide deacetylase family protein [Flavipsychrobacter sp.]|nr:polysaccharide deacetylase family protein [Flavipsychrobacter sp.]